MPRFWAQTMTPDDGRACSTRATSRDLFYRAITQVNRMLTHPQPESSIEDILSRGVSLIANILQAPLVWIGIAPNGQSELSIAAAASPGVSGLASMRVSVDPDVPEGAGPSGQSVRSGQPYVCHRDDPIMAPWRNLAIANGIGGFAGAPFYLNEGDRGIVSICRRDEESFPEDVVGLIFHLAEDVGTFLDRLCNLLNQLVSNIHIALDEYHSRQQLAAERESHAWQAHHDCLTGLPNRLGLARRLGDASARALRHERLLAVGMLDLDDFKAINDIHGHAIGDRLLVDMAGRLKRALRHTDFAARLGGDEFVLVLEDLQDLGYLEAVIAKVGEVLCWADPRVGCEKSPVAGDDATAEYVVLPHNGRHHGLGVDGHDHRHRPSCLPPGVGGHAQSLPDGGHGGLDSRRRCGRFLPANPVQRDS